ncbi:hypothetical protein [cf. Phormidesmis sp. LEGE 11477]|nr:hypothetical protein [cf. Phormidesmis sp. LEGE 11477]
MDAQEMIAASALRGHQRWTNMIALAQPVEPIIVVGFCPVENT